MYGGDVRPKTGAPSIFPEDLESEIALFVSHCRLLRIPRSRSILRDDIVHYVQYAKLNFPKMHPNGPGDCNEVTVEPCITTFYKHYMLFMFLGRSWFERFRVLWEDFAELLSKAQIMKIENDPVSIKSWIYERENYTRLYRQPKRYATKKYIFVMELIVFEIQRKNLLQYCVMVKF